MEQYLPYSIKNEQDLDAFQRYIDQMPDTSSKPKPPALEEAPAKPKDDMSIIPGCNSSVPDVLNNTCYLPAYLSKHIGKLMRVESLVANTLHERTGILMTVGATYIVLKSPQSNATMTCDLDSIRFITIAHDNNMRKLLK